MEDFDKIETEAEVNSHDLLQALNHHKDLTSVIDNDQTFFFDRFLTMMLESSERKYISTQVTVFKIYTFQCLWSPQKLI